MPNTIKDKSIVTGEEIGNPNSNWRLRSDAESAIAIGIWEDNNGKSTFTIKPNKNSDDIFPKTGEHPNPADLALSIAKRLKEGDRSASTQIHTQDDGTVIVTTDTSAKDRISQHLFSTVGLM